MTEGILTSISFRNLEGSERLSKIWIHFAWQILAVTFIIAGFTTIYQNKVGIVVLIFQPFDFYAFWLQFTYRIISCERTKKVHRSSTLKLPHWSLLFMYTVCIRVTEFEFSEDKTTLSSQSCSMGYFGGPDVCICLWVLLRHILNYCRPHSGCQSQRCRIDTPCAGECWEKSLY